MTEEEALRFLEQPGVVRRFARKTGTPEQTVYTWRHKKKIPTWRLSLFNSYDAANDNAGPDDKGAA